MSCPVGRGGRSIPVCFCKNSPISARKSNFESPENAQMILTRRRLVTYCSTFSGDSGKSEMLDIVLDDVTNGLVEE
jgi:hypothetical protein